MVGEGYETVKEETFYRPFGGSIEFDEKAEDTLRREISEEIGEHAVNIRFMGVLENMFNYENEKTHEIIFVYSAALEVKAVYDMDVIEVDENGIPQKAYWKEMEDFKSRKLILYPEGLIELISKTSKTP